jgi:hypothetical protein
VYREIAAQSSFMTVEVADAHAHVQRLVSVVKMATVLEECINEEQRSVFVFLLCVCGKKDSMQRIFVKKCFLFILGSDCRVKRFYLGGKCFSDEEKVETEVRK